MHKVSKFQKGGIIGVIMLLMVSSASAALTYNPETGTYTDDSVQADEDSIWIPIEDEQQPVTTTSSTTTGDVTTVTTTVIELDTTDPIIEVTETTTTTTAAPGSIAGLESGLADTVGGLASHLDIQASTLAGVYNNHIASRYGAAFGELIACIGDDNAVSQIQHEVQNIVDTLSTRIKTDSADIFAQIANLEYRNDIGLVDAGALDIEARALTSTIAAFKQTYTSLVDEYTTQARVSITDFVDTEEAAEYETLLQSYLARRSKLDQLKQAFTAFENGSFFSQTVVGPRADDLEILADDIFAIFRSDMLGQWANRSPAAFDTMISVMRADFDVKVQDTIQTLFPYGNIEGLYNSYNLLAGIYGLGGDEYFCQAVISNDSVDTAGPTLMNSIESVQQDMAVAMSAVGGATSWMELQEGLSDILLGYYQTDLLSQFQSAYATAETIVLSESEQLHNSYKAQVVTFLLGMRGDYVSNDNLLGFETRLERAYGRVEAAIADGAEGRLLLILQAIGAAIIEVLQG